MAQTPIKAASSALSIEVGDITKVTQVTRDGQLVRAPTLSEDHVADLLDRLAVPPRNRLPRVVGQSVTPGSLVQRGTVVDLTLVSPDDTTFEVFGPVHPALRTKTVGTILTAMPTPVTTIVNAKPDPATLSATERTTVTQFLQTQQIATAGGTAENSFESVYGRLIDAQAFK
ncbi:MAG TPA: hypothetical protein VFK02_19270 [Kofleriaceae bacterium]|nr:hypothetical protein [Kofleriaceae bacterium]